MQPMHLLLLYAFFLFKLTLSGSFKIGDLDFSASELFEKGLGIQQKSSQFEEKGAKGDIGYKLFHQDAKGAKGSHDKEGHKTAYAELDGGKKTFHHNDGYFAEKHKGEKGDRGYNYEDHAHFAKGHKTKGRHNIHNIDEYKKKTEFYDEDHDEGHQEKHGGYEIKKQIRDGGFHKNGHTNKSFLEDLFGKLDQFNKGSHLKEDSGYKKATGKGAVYKKGVQFSNKDELEAFKKFGFSETR